MSSAGSRTPASSPKNRRMLFSNQQVHCNVCGKPFETQFRLYDGRFCSQECCDEYNWRKTLSIMGKAYYPRDSKPEKE